MIIAQREGYGIPAQSIRTIETDEGAALLDIEHGVCLNLSVVAAEIWRLLQLNHSVTEIVDYLEREFDASRAQIHEDVTQFIAMVQQKGLLVSARSARPRGRLPNLLSTCLLRWHKARSPTFIKRPDKHPHLLFMQAIAALCAFDLLRFGNHFDAICRFVQYWTVSDRVLPQAVIDQVCIALDYACLWYPKRALCLQRSVVRTCLLRNCGINAQMVLGGRNVPFQAHAWTEVCGAAIHERRDVQNVYLVWERF
jgi:hypothetical protein